MKNLLHETNDILISNTSDIPFNYGEIQAKKHINKFKEQLSKHLNEDCVEYNDFLKEMQFFIDKVDSDNWDDFEDF